jgi:hypothetical protein
MKTSRVFLAGVVGGIAMFIWASLAHVVLPLGTIGVGEISGDEPALLGLLHTTVGENSGFYIFPSSGWKPGDSSERKAAAMKTYDQKLAANPSGLLIYHPPGEKSFTPGQLIAEFLTELCEALLAAYLLAQTRLLSFAARVGFVAVAGLLASLPTNLSYVIWYGFPGNYTIGYMAVQIIGFFVAGLAIAALTRQRPSLAV